MAGFDIDAYLNARVAADDKLTKLANASERKRADLEALNAIRQPDSWASQLGLSRHSGAGRAVNLAADVVSGIGRVAGHLVAAPGTLAAASAQNRLDEDDIAALGRYEQGKATPEDVAKINRKIAPTVEDDPYNIRTDEQRAAEQARMQAMVDADPDAPTPLKLWQQANRGRMWAESARDAGDLKSIVNQSGKNELVQDLKEGFAQPWQQIQEGGVVNVVQGIGGLILNAFEAAGNNKTGAAQFVAENIPQLALGLAPGGQALLASSNVGYALDEYSKGIDNYRAKNGGALPPLEERQRMAALAASLALAEQAGDVVTLGATKLLGRSAKDAVTQDFKQSLLNIGQAGAKGAATEAATEGYQTYAEGELQGKPASAEDIYVGASIGGIVGGALAGGGRSLSEVTGLTPEKLTARLKALNEEAEKDTRVQQAIDTGDVSSLSNPDSKDYAPQQAIAALFGFTQKTDTTPEQKQAALAQGNEIVEDLTTRLEAAREDRTMQTVEGTQGMLAETRRELEAASEGTKSLLAQKINMLEANLAALEQTPDRSKELRQLDTQISRMERQLSEAQLALTVLERSTGAPDQAVQDEQKVQDLAQPAATAPKRTEQEITDEVITLSMASGEPMTAEQAEALAADETNALSPRVRKYLRVFSEARQKENALQSMEGVAKTVLYGDRKNLGIKQYHGRLARALRSSDRAQADRAVAGIEKFARDHQAKAVAARQAISQGLGRQIVRTKDGRWVVPTKDVSRKELSATGGLVVNSPRLVQAIEIEAQALVASATVMREAVDLKFNSQPANTDVQDPTTGTNLGSSEAQGAGQAPAQEPAAAGPVESAAGRSAGAGSRAAAPDADLQLTESTPSTEGTSGSSVESLSDVGSELSSAELTQETQSTEQTEGENQSTEDDTTSTPAQDAPGGQVLPPSSTPTESTQPDGLLRVIREGGVEAPTIGLAAVYKTLNKAAAWLTQRRKEVNEDRDIAQVRPLVEMQNFLSRWAAGEVEIESFFPDGFPTNEEGESPQKNALANFLKVAREWSDSIRADFIKGSLPNSKGNIKPREFWFQDPLQDLIPEDGVVDENLITAVAYGAYGWLYDSINTPEYQTNENLLEMHGLDPEEVVTRAGREALGKVAGFRDALINAMGRRAWDALGLKVKDNAPADYQSKVTAALGAHAMVLLEREGLIELKTFSDVEMRSFLPSGTFQDNESRTYIQLVRDGREMPNTSRSIKETSAGSSGVIDRLFGAERAPTWAQWKPVKFAQQLAKRTQQKVPRKLRKILEKAQETEHRVIPEMWRALQVLGDEAVLVAAGFKPEDETGLNKVHVALRDAVLAQNENLRFQLDAMKTLVQTAEATSPEGINQPFFINFEVWRNFRVGVSTRDLNPQSSKIHRFSFYRPHWKSTIDLTNAKSVETFKVALAQALGLKVDQQPNAHTVEKFDAKLADTSNRIAELARKLDLAIKDPQQALSEADQAAIGELAAGAEGMQTLQALVVLGQYLAAKAAGENKLTVTMLVGVDGKTNGPILSQLALGAAATGRALLARLNRGGMFGLRDRFKNYNHWYAQPNSQDLYENLAQEILKLVDESDPVFAAISTITKTLVENNKVTSAGRNIVKTPLTAFAFGSSLDKSIQGMTDKFVESVFERIQAVATSQDSRTSLAALVGAINTLIGDKDLALPKDITIDALMEWAPSKVQEAAIRHSFGQVMGQPVNDAMETYFKAFIDRRKAANQAVQASFGIYYAIYQDIRRREIDRLMDAGEIDFKVKEGKRVPLHDMTVAQERVLRDLVARVLPRAHTAYTDSDELDAGLYMAKTAEVQGKTDNYGIEVSVGRLFKGVRYVKTRGMQRTERDPGVAGLPYWMHSQDSFIMHLSLELGDIETLNVHDEAGNGVGRVSQIAQAINKATWQSFLNFSGSSEAYALLERSIVNAAEMLGKGELSQEALNKIANGLASYLPLKQHRNPAAYALLVLQRAKSQAFDATRVRLEALSEFSAIDQYTWEGGEYRVTDQDRAKARSMLDAHLAAGPALTPDVVAAAEALGAALRDGPPKSKEEAELDETLEAVSFPKAPIQAMQVLEHGQNDESLPQIWRDTMGAVLAAMVEKGMALKAAVMSAVEPAMQAGFVQILADRLAALPQDVWGDRGTPMTPPDARLVKFFENNTDVSAKRVIEGLARIYRGDSKQPNRAFNLKLLQVLDRLVDPGLKVLYVTPATAPSQALGKVDKSRGWYAYSTTQQQIAVLSPDFVHSGLTPEVLVHELTHSVLSRVVSDIQAGNGTPEAKALVAELEQLLEAARAQVAGTPLALVFAPALTDINELIAWGMTNQDFQRNVLNKLQFKSQNWGNQLVSGVKALIGALARLLFKDADNRKHEIASNGLGVLIGNVSGLFAYAAQVKTKTQQAIEDVQVNPMASPSGAAAFNTLQIHRALDDGSVTPGFQDHLAGLLEGIVESLHGPFGSFEETLRQQQAVSPLDAWMKALASGKVPFGSKALASGFRISQQEAFVLEQVEATVRAALQDGTTTTISAYRELVRLYEEAQRTLKVEDFHPGNWATATPDEKARAQALHEFVFKLEPRLMGTASTVNRSEHLARFAALGLAHQDFNKILQRATERSVRTSTRGMSFADRLQRWFNKLLSMFQERWTHTYGGQNADEKLTSLVEQLVGIEAKKRHTLARKMASNSIFDKIEDQGTKVNEGIRNTAAKAFSAPIFRNSGNAFVRLAGKVGTMVAKDQMDAFMEALADVRDQMVKGRQGVISGVFNYVRGPLEKFQALLRMGKNIERERKSIISGTAKLVRATFAQNGEKVTAEQRSAISAVLLRSGAHALLDHLGPRLTDAQKMARLERLVSDPNQVMQEIDRIEAQLAGFGSAANFFKAQANALGYFRAQGKVTIPFLLMNAHNIVRMNGTPYRGRLAQDQQEVAQPLVEALVSLYTLRYSDSVHLDAVKEVLRTENQRTDGGNGIQFTLMLHKQMQQESLERLFDGRPELMMHGYLPEIYNPHVELRTVTLQQGAELEQRGYVRGAQVPRDPSDPDTDAKYLYVLKDGGLERYQSGAFSFTSKDSRGTSMHDGYLNPHTQQGLENAQLQGQIARDRRPHIRAMFDPVGRVDHSRVRTSFLAPVVNNQGEVVNYRYLMNEHTKDTLLDRDNRFDTLMGVLAGSVFDKQASREHNAEVVQALKDQFDAEWATKPDAYVEIGPKVSDPELRELWSLIPEDTRLKVIDVWGDRAMMVRSDSLDILFGYRKYSVAQSFEKDRQDRNIPEAAFVSLAELVFGKKAALKLRKGERAWQEIVTEVKDIIVVKTGVVLLGNLWSNMTLLWANGVSTGDIVRHHKVALRAATDYHRDMARLREIETRLDTGYSQGEQAKLEREATLLRDAISRNPVKELIDAGLMPTIVEDVAQEDDIYSYRSLLTRKFEEKTSWVNDSVMSAARTIYMAHDTPLYQGLSRITQLSDFVARYTLYQHLVSRKRDPLSKEDAIQKASDAFVNYDIPMHKVLQYTDDMGITLFTKYFLSIQRVLARLFKEHPARVLTMLAADRYLGLGPIVLDGSFIAHMGNNPLNTGALRIVDTVDELATIQSAMALMR